MLTLKIKFILCIFPLVCCPVLSAGEVAKDSENPVDITDFIVIEKIRIPILTDLGIDFFEFDVKITGLHKKDVDALKSYESRIRDLILSDSFDSVTALVYGQKNVSANQINALQRRIWICILKWIKNFNLPIRVSHVDILHAKFFAKRKIK